MGAPFRVIVAGSRTFTDYERLKKVLDEALRKRAQDGVVIVSGTARGADQLGERYAEERGYAVERFPANWQEYGKAAGFIRNKQMAEHADGLMAFWDGQSKGTHNMIQLAVEYGLKVIVAEV